MPDSSIFTGFSNVDSEMLQQDTQQRLDKMFGGNNTLTGEQPTAKSWTPDLSTSPDKNINIDLTPEQRSEISQKESRNKILSSPQVSKGVGQYRYVPYDTAKRYAKQDQGFFFDADNEDFYAQSKQSGVTGFVGGVGKTLGRFALGTVAKVGQSLGYIAGMVDPENWDKNYFLNAADNSFAKYFEKLDNETKNDWMPVFQEASDRNKGFWNRMFTDSTFWTNEVSDGAAFMASAFIPAAIISKLGLGARVLAGASKFAGDTNAILGGTEYLAKATNYLKNAQKYASAIDKVAITALNTASEAMFEAKGVSDKVYKDALGKGYSDEDAKKIANHAAKNTFWANALALSVSNAWETKLFTGILNKEVKLARRVAALEAVGTGFESGVQKAAEATTRFGRFWNSAPMYYAKTIGEGVLVEGIWEENIQLAIQRYNENYTKNKNKGFWTGLSEIAPNYLKQTGAALSGDDTEASMNIGLGGLLGGGGGVRMAYAERKEEKETTERLINSINNAKSDWLKVSDLYEKDDKDPTQVKFVNGKPVFDSNKLLSIFNEQQANTKALAELQQIANPVLHSMVKKQLFSNYFFASKNAGREDAVIDELNKLRTNGTQQQLLSIGATDAKEIDEYVKYAKDLSKLDSSIDNDILMKNKDMRTEHDRSVQMARKQYLRYEGAKMLASKIELDKVTSKINDLNIDLNSKYEMQPTHELASMLNNISRRINYQDNYIKHLEAVFNNVNDLTHNITYKEIESAKSVLEQMKTDKQKMLDDNKDSFKRKKKIDFEDDKTLPKDSPDDLTSPIVLFENGLYRSSAISDREKDPSNETLKNLEDLKSQFENLSKQSIEDWYNYANTKDGFTNFKEKYQKDLAAHEATKEEVAKEVVEEQAKHTPTGKTLSYTVMTSNGVETTVEIEEGAVYLGPKITNKVVDRNGHSLETYDNVRVKVLEINGDKVTLLIGDETVTYDKSELYNLGKLTNYNDLTLIQKFAINHRNKAFWYSIPWKGPNGQKTKIVRGRIELDKTGTKLVVKYKDEKGKVRYIAYNENYLRDKAGNKTTSLSKAMSLDLAKFTPEEEFMLQQEQLARKQAIDDQIVILSNLIDQRIKEASVAKERIESINNKIQEVQLDLEIEKETLDKTLNDLKNVKSVKNARYIREQLKKEADRIRKHIQELEAIKIDLQTEHDSQEEIVKTAQAIEEYYSEYGYNIIDNEDPIVDFKSKLEELSSQYEKLYPEKTEEGLDPIELIFAQATQELKDLQSKITKLDDYIDLLRDALAKYEQGLQDENFDASFWKQSLEDSIKERAKALERFENVKKEINLFAEPIIESRLVNSLAASYLPLLNQRLHDDKIQKAAASVTTQEGEHIPMAILDGEDVNEDDKIFTEGAKPVFSLNFVDYQKTFMKHYYVDPVSKQEVLNENEYARRFFKFTSSINLSNGPYFLEVVTEANDKYNIRHDNTDIRLVVSRKDTNGEMKPVDLNGNILENPTKDTMIYTSMMYEVEQLYKKAGIDQAYEYVKKVFTLDKATPEETDAQLEARIKAQIPIYVKIRENIIKASNEGKSIYLPIASKSGGIEVKEARNPITSLYPQESLEGRVTIEDPSDEDWKSVDLIVATAGTTNWQTGSRSVKLGIDGKLAEGRMAIRQPDGNTVRTYNRKFTDNEVDTLADAILQYSTLFYQDNLSSEDEAIKNRLDKYLKGVLFWSVPTNTKTKNEKDSPVSEKRVWLGYKNKLAQYDKFNVDTAQNMHPYDRPGLHIGNTNHPLTSLNKEALKLLINTNLAYHQVTNKILKDNSRFYTPIYTNGALDWQEWNSYKEYLMTSEGGKRKAPLYVNIVKRSESINEPQFKNVYLRFAIPDELKPQEAKPENSPVAKSTTPTANITPATKAGEKIGELKDIANGQTVVIKSNLKGKLGLRVETVVKRNNNTLETISAVILNPDNTYYEDPEDPGYVLRISNVWNGGLAKPANVDTFEIFAKDTVTPSTTTEIKPVTPDTPSPVAQQKPAAGNKTLNLEAFLEKARQQQEQENQSPKEDKKEDDEDVPYRLAISQDPNRRDDVDKVRSFFNENLPQIPVEVVDHLIDSIAWGAFDKGVVKIFNQAAYGTGFHEAFEAVWNALLTPTERNALMNEFRSKSGTFTNPFSKETKAYKDASLYDIRETLAEDFADFMDNEGKDIKKNEPKRNSIFLRLWKRLLAWLGLSTDKKSEVFDTINKVYKAIPGGRFKERVPTSYEGTHYAAIKDLDQRATSLVLEGLHAYFFSNLGKKKLTIESLLNGTLNTGQVDSIFKDCMSDMSKAMNKYMATEGLAEGITEDIAISVFTKLNDNKAFIEDIISKHRDFLKRYKIVLETTGKVSEDPEKDNPEEATLTKEEDVKDNLGILESMFVDTRNMASASVRLTLASLSNMEYNEKTKGYVFRRNEFGFPRLNDYGKVMNVLTNDLQGITETSRNGEYVSRLDRMMETLDAKYKVNGRYKNNFEWIAMLKKRLGIEELNGNPIDFNNLDEDTVTLRIAFEKGFANTKINPMSILASPENVFVTANPLIASSEEQMRQTWMNNAKVYSKAGLPTYTIEGTNLIVNKNITKELAQEITNNTPEQLIEYLANLGIEIKTDLNKFVQGSYYFKTLNEAVQSIISTLEKEDVLTFNDLFGRQVINNSLKKLIAMELMNSSEDTSLQWLNPEGKTVYSITLPSYWSNVLNSLKSVNNRHDFINLNPQFGKIDENGKVVLKTYQENSKFLSLGGLVFDSKGNKRNDIDYTLIAGMSNHNESYGENTSDLTFVDKIAVKTFCNLNGIYQTIINSDKSNEYGIGLGNFVSYDEVSFLSKAIANHYLPYLEDELNSAINSKDESVKIQYYESGVTKLGHFRSIIKSSKSLIDAIIKGDTNVKQIYSDVNVLADIKTYLEKVVERDINKYLQIGFIEKLGSKYSSLFLSGELLSKFNIDPKDMTEAQVRNLLMYIDFNEQISSIEQHKLIYGHPALYKDLAKRSSGANSTKETIVEDRALLEKLDREDPRADGRVRNSKHGYILKTVAYKDVIAVQSDAKIIAEKLYEAYSKSDKMSKLQKENAIGANFDSNGNLLKFTGGGSMAAYLELNEADAQAYIMPDYYKDLLRLSAKLSKEQKAQLEYEAAYERLVRSGTIASPKTNRTISEKDKDLYKPYTNIQLHKETTDSKNRLEKDMEIFEKGSPGGILPTLKPQYFGPQENEDLLHVTFLKHSIQPKFFREAEGTNFEKLYIASQTNGIDIIGFESGEKVGNVLNNKKGFTALYDDRGDLNVDFTRGIDNNNLPPIQNLYSKYYGIQVEMAGKVKDKVRRGSQMTKLILANLMQKGVPITENVKANIRAYIDTLNQLIDLGMEELKSELGITIDKDGDYVIKDLNKLVDAIKGEVLSRELPDNIVDSLGVHPETGKLLYKFDTLPIREKIDNILNSMADKRIVSQKMNGKPAAQVSSSLTETGKREWVYLKDGIYTKAENINQLSDKEKDTLRLTSNDLEFYQNGTMEILMPNYLEAFLPVGAEFNLKNVDPRILKSIGFRIPTQSMGQIENIKIKGFLPKELGDIVVVPTGIVGKAGSDFDIDKLNLLLPNFYVTKDNKFVYIDPTLTGEALLSAIEETKYSHSELKRKMLENQLISQMSSLLELPENFRQLISPNAAETLKALRAEKNKLTDKGKEEQDPTGLSEFLKMAEIRERYVSSKVLVGIGAVHITSHTICQLGDIKLTGTYIDTRDNQVKDVTIRLKASDKKDGKYSLALIENAEGVLITDLLSEAMTGFVDAAKDPFVFELNFNKDTAATWFYLLKLGVPIEQVAFFHTQPIIEEYIMYKQANDSMIRKLNKSIDDKSQLTNLQIKARTLDKYYGVFFGRGLEQAALNSKKAFNALYSKLDKELISYRDANPTLSLKSMKDDIKYLSVTNHKISKDEAIRQISILEDFLIYTEHANYLTGFVNSINYDTARTKSLVENKLQELAWKKTSEKDNFIENPNDALDVTFLRNLKDKRESLQNMFKEFFVILNDKSADSLKLIMNKIEGREFADQAFAYTDDKYNPVYEKFKSNKNSQVQVLNRFQSFFVNYILGVTKITVGTQGREMSINNHYNLLRDTPTRLSLAKQLMDMKKLYPNNQALQELYPIINSDSNGTDNIKLFGTKMTTYENNVIIESISDLMKYAENIGDRKLEGFIKNLTMFAIMQSGVQMSPISFTKALPTFLYSELTAKMINKYTEVADYTVDPYLVYKQFHQNNWKNPDIVPRVKIPTSLTFDDELPIIRISANDGFKMRYVSNRFFLNTSLKTRNKEDLEQMRKNKEDIFNYQLYEYSYYDSANDQYVYRPINRLGNGQYHVEVYDRDTSTMSASELPNSKIYGHIDERNSKQTSEINSESVGNSENNSNFVNPDDQAQDDLNTCIIPA